MIRDNPSMVDLRRFSESYPTIWRLRPFLMLLGEKGREVARALGHLRPEMMRDLHDAIEIPDGFNSAFAPRGWVAYWGLGADVMRRALDIAGAGELDAAERFLTDYYDAAALEYHLPAALKAEVVRRRERLLRKAAEDHLEGRYHASVPVVLAQIDGIAIDLTGTYFFAPPRMYARQSGHMVAADTFAGHPSGLRALAAVLGAYRAETTTQPLGTPYRHGVAHGRDLAYDTKTVSSKSFAALFAVAEWARKVEKGEHDKAHPPALPDFANFTMVDLWPDLKGIYHAERQRYICWRTGRPFTRPPALRSTYAHRVYTRYIEPYDTEPEPGGGHSS